jgi:hypothetical protein
VSAQVEDDDDLNLAEEDRCSFENFDPRSLTNLAEDMVEERDGQAICGGGRAGRVDELR